MRRNPKFCRPCSSEAIYTSPRLGDADIARLGLAARSIPPAATRWWNEYISVYVERKEKMTVCDVCSYNPVRYLRLCRIKSFSAGAVHIIFFDPFLSINKGYKRPRISDAGGRKADTKTQKLVWCIVCTPMKQNWLPKEKKNRPKWGGGGGRAGGGGQKVRGNLFDFRLFFNLWKREGGPGIGTTNQLWWTSYLLPLQSCVSYITIICLLLAETGLELKFAQTGTKLLIWTTGTIFFSFFLFPPDSLLYIKKFFSQHSIWHLINK